jgi:hypothetical protein
MDIGRNDPCPCGSGKKHKKCCQGKPAVGSVETGEGMGDMRVEKIMDVGTSHPVVARLGLGMCELLEYTHLSLQQRDFVIGKMLETIPLLVELEKIAEPVISEVNAALDEFGKTGIPEDAAGAPIFNVKCKTLQNARPFFRLCARILDLALSTLNMLWGSAFTKDNVSEMPDFITKKFGDEHILSKLMKDDYPWVCSLIEEINFAESDKFDVKDFSLSTKNADGKYQLTPPILSNGSQIANVMEVYTYDLFTFLEEMTVFSLLPHFDPRLIIVEIPEAARRKEAVVRFKVGIKPGVDVDSFKGDPRLEKIFRSGQQAFHIREKARERQFGRIKPIIHADFKGQKVVAVNNTLHRGKWVTFSDFLYDYLKIKFGKDWWLAEVKKGEATCCPVITWARKLYEHQKTAGVQEGGLFSADPNGPMGAYYSLAYDLFVLEDNKSLQESLLDRMRTSDRPTFWGARYEAMVAATLIKAGFDLTYEDESDNRKTHPEFLAIHRDTAEQIDVEAKKRNRSVAPQSESDVRLNIADLLKSAMKKFSGRPFVIFLELDLPPIDGDPLRKPWFKELLDSISDSGTRDSDGKDSCNLIVFTNYPTDNPQDASKYPPQTYIVSQSMVPKVPLKNNSHLSEIISTVERRLKIPTWFEE